MEVQVITDKTTISNKLHKQALAWFEDHPGKGHFLRRFVPGEFSAQSLANMQRDLGGAVAYVYVKRLGGHLATRMPMTAEVYQTMPMQLRAATPLIDLSNYREHRCAKD